MLQLTASVVLVQASLFGAFQNGGFEDGLAGWITSHDWYARPPGGGLSRVEVVDGAGPEGRRALRLTGDGKRGLAMQVQPVSPGPYRVSAWIRCQGLAAGKAGVFVEWMSRDAKWMHGDWAGEAAGDSDWQHFETVVTAPPGARSVHLDLMTTEPNSGTAWFAGVTFERVRAGTPPPPPPAVTAVPAQAGEIEVRWDPAALGTNVVRLLLYAAAERPDPAAGAVPRVLCDGEEGRQVLAGFAPGRVQQVAAVAIDGDGQASAVGPTVEVAAGRQAAVRPGWLEAERLAVGGPVRVGWRPHVLSSSVERIHIVLPGEAPEPVREVATTPVVRTPQPFYDTTPVVTATVDLPADSTRLGARAQGADGNLSEPVWTDILAPAAAGPLPAALWTAPPTANLAPTATAPAALASAFDLTLMRGQAKGFQLALRPERDLHHARVRVGDLVHANGRDRVAAHWVAWHPVRYVALEKNSRATPREELVWPGPAEYPDELGDAPWLDLGAARTQPLYVRVTAPRDAAPGVYEARGQVEADEGRLPFTVRVRIAPVELPARLRLHFVYWFAWEETCKRFGVAPSSEDGWRVLACLADLMREHHQDTVVVPYSLVHSWQRPDGTPVHDFRDFDRFVQTFREHGVDQLFCVSHVGSRTTGEWECPTMGSHRHEVRRTDTGEATSVDAVDLLPAIEQHVRDLGLLERFAVHVADEPIPVNLESYRALSERVRKAAPGLRRIDAIHVPNLAGSLEIWVPQLNYFEQWQDAFRQAQATGNELWFYIAWVPQGAYPNRMIDSHAVKPRVLHWLNALYDTTGYLHWALNHWQIPLTSLESPGDQYICWPSQRFVANSSLRYEAEREGLEDCELLFLVRDSLQKRGVSRAQAQERIRELARPAVQDIQHYTRSWEDLEAVRLTLLAELERPAAP